MESENIINRLRKIQLLAQKGEAGEAEAAKKLLKDILAKYNINESEISDTKKDYSFNCSNDLELKLLFHCAANLFGSQSDLFKSCFYYKKNNY